MSQQVASSSPDSVSSPAAASLEDAMSEDTKLLARVGATSVELLSGQKVKLRDLWSGAPTVVVFLRQFGCIFCHEMVEEIVRARGEIVQRGGQLVVIGNGTIDHARRFYASKGLPSTGVIVSTDAAQETYRAAELERGVKKTFWNGGSKRAYARASTEGHRITGVTGDVFQLGGVLVVRPGSRLGYRHVSRYAGDLPDMGAVLGAIQG